MASQSVEDVLKLKIARAIVEQTQTHIFFPNKKANYEDYVNGLSCTVEEFETIKKFNPAQYPFLVKNSDEAVVVNLDLSKLGKENISIISTSTAHVETIRSIFSQENLTLNQKVENLRTYYKNI